MARKKSTSKKKARRTSKRSNDSSFPLDELLDGVGIALTVTGVLTGLAMLPSSEPSMLQPWLDLLAEGFGTLALAAPLAMLVFGVWLIARRFENAPAPPWYRLLGGALVAVALFGLLGLVQQGRAPDVTSSYGGRVGLVLARGLTLAVGRIGAWLTLLIVGVQGLLFLLELSLADLGRGLRRLWQRLRPNPTAPESPWPKARPREAGRVRQLSLAAVPQVVEQGRAWWQQARDWVAARRDAQGAVAPPAASPRAAPPRAAPDEPLPPLMTIPSNWTLPPWPSLLESNAETAAADEDIRRKTHIIEETLAHFGVPAKVVEINRGPTVTQYGVEPGFLRKRVRGEERDIKVKVSAITNLQNDLALALAARRIRLEAPVPGKSYVGIEVPNDRADVVTLRDAMESDAFARLQVPLRMALGRDVMGRAVVADLARMPHLLIAGATGAGKSVCVNAIISCLLCHNTPDQLKLLMVDPKMVELIGYNGIPHLITPVVTDIERVVGLLRWTISEMERRYKLFSEARVRHLQAYNAKAIETGEQTLPYLVLIIDELADLMMAAGAQVEEMVCRLAQLARATGIHLILATQRPSVDVVTGLIKANFPARIAFAVTSGIDSLPARISFRVATKVDSRTILDANGAESLLGRGDMLYQAADSGALVRAQGCFVSDGELERINRHWLQQIEAQKQPRRTATAPAETEEAVPPVQAVLWDDLLEDERENDPEEDELLPKARELVADAGRASISMLQRRLRVGYARAARIVDLLEQEGTIGSSEGPGKHREVYVDEEEALEGEEV